MRLSTYERVGNVRVAAESHDAWTPSRNREPRPELRYLAATGPDLNSLISPSSAACT